MSTLRIALAQCRQVNDPAANLQRVFSSLEQAAAQQARLVCFPETQTVGYRVDIVPADAPVPVAWLNETHARVADRCRQLGVACILGTETPLESDPHRGKPYNSALVIDEQGQIVGVHHKTRLTPLDAVAYSPGTGVETFNVCGVTIGVVICFEGFRFPETTRQCVRQGAKIVFHPQNNTTRPNPWKIPIHHAMIITRAAENTVWFASCNCQHVPHQNCRSMIVAPDGRIHGQTELGAEELLVRDVDLDKATHAMANYDLANTAELLFADTVDPREYQTPPAGLAPIHA